MREGHWRGLRPPTGGRGTDGTITVSSCMHGAREQGCEAPGLVAQMRKGVGLACKGCGRPGKAAMRTWEPSRGHAVVHGEGVRLGESKAGIVLSSRRADDRTTSARSGALLPSFHIIHSISIFTQHTRRATGMKISQVCDPV